MSCRCKQRLHGDVQSIADTVLDVVQRLPVVIKNAGASSDFEQRRSDLLIDAYVKGLGGIKTYGLVYTVPAAQFETIAAHAMKFYQLSMEKVVNVENPFVTDPAKPVPVPAQETAAGGLKIWHFVAGAAALYFFIRR